jgi:hypothetical protein
MISNQTHRLFNKLYKFWKIQEKRNPCVMSEKYLEKKKKSILFIWWQETK